MFFEAIQTHTYSKYAYFAYFCNINSYQIDMCKTPYNTGEPSLSAKYQLIWF